uniref:Uncharacterized protein n=1 Tax=Daphnia galeata TaxID=27404 RepID=A0A8J2WHT5_9CRUS|nr:unnamed protein product [Daphnia galeata]
MRDLVNQFSFLERKRLDTTMHWSFPNWWVPLYTSMVLRLIWSTGTAAVVKGDKLQETVLENSRLEEEENQTDGPWE